MSTTRDPSSPPPAPRRTTATAADAGLADAITESRVKTAPSRRGPIAELRDVAGRFRSTMRWLVSELLATVGRSRLLGTAALAAAGSAGISVSGFVVIAVIRISAPNATESLGTVGFVPDWPLPVMFAIILTGGVTGAYLFYRSEREVSRAAIDFGGALRSRLVALIDDPGARGWQSIVADRPQKVLLQIAVSDVREITMAARETVRLIGPLSIVVFIVAILFVMEPLVTAVVLPLTVVAAIPLLLINRRLGLLNESFESAQGSTRDRISESAMDLERNGHEGRPVLGLASARLGDDFAHERILQPVRVRALATVATSFFIVIVLSIFIVRADADESVNFFRIIVYLICLRLVLGAGQKIAAALVSVTRRSLAIGRFRRFEEDLVDYCQERRIRAADSPMPNRLRLVYGDDRLRIRKGQTTIVLVPRRPTIGLAEEILLTLEAALAPVAAGPIDLLGSARVTFGDQTLHEGALVAAMGEEEFDVQPVHVAVQADVAEVASATTAAFTFVVTQLPGQLLQDALDQWSHLLSGVVVVTDGEIAMGGDVEWARSNRQAIQRALGR